MLVSQGRCDMIILLYAHDDEGSGMKHTLETINCTVWQACKDGIAVVNSIADKACDKSDGSISGSERLIDLILHNE